MFRCSNKDLLYQIYIGYIHSFIYVFDGMWHIHVILPFSERGHVMDQENIEQSKKIYLKKKFYEIAILNAVFSKRRFAYIPEELSPLL